MQSVKLNEASALEMRKFYEEELEKTVKRLEHIKTVLDQLSNGAVKVDLNIRKSEASSVSASATVAPAGVKAEAKPASTGKKRGPKAVWESLVLKRLRQMDRPVTYEQLTDEIMVFAKLPAEKRLNTKRAIVNVAFKLRNRDHKIDTFSNGSREKYIALKSWFDEGGKIKKEYVKKIVA